MTVASYAARAPWCGVANAVFWTCCNCLSPVTASVVAPAFVTGDGAPVGDFARFGRMASLTALSLETNGGLCRDLLRVRYPDEEGVAV